LTSSELASRIAIHGYGAGEQGHPCPGRTADERDAAENHDHEGKMPTIPLAHCTPPLIASAFLGFYPPISKIADYALIGSLPSFFSAPFSFFVPRCGLPPTRVVAAPGPADRRPVGGRREPLQILRSQGGVPPFWRTS